MSLFNNELITSQTLLGDTISSQLQSLLDLKANVTDVYNKQYIDALIALYYTKTEINDTFYTKTFIDDNFYTQLQSNTRYYTKTYVDDLIALYYPKITIDANFYTKIYIDDLISNYYRN